MICQSFRKTVPILLVPLFLTGCVVGQTYTFDHSPRPFENIGDGRTVLLFAVKDARPYVVAGEEAASFIGEQRSGWGIPYSVKTENGRPVSAIVQEAIEGDLTAAGFEVTAVREMAPESPDRIKAFLARQDATRGLAVTMDQLYSDTMTDISMHWNLAAVVFDADGSTLAQVRRQGHRELAGSFWDPVGAAKDKVPEFIYQTIIPSLVLENETIRTALVSDVPVMAESAGEAKGCTEEQFLAMIEIGLKGEQIRAACKKEQQSESDSESE